MIMDNLEKIFDDVIKERKEERKLKDEYFADIKKKSLGFINSTYEKLLFLNKKGFRVYKHDVDDMEFYIDYPNGNLGDCSMTTSKITSVSTPYTYLGETRSYPRTDVGFIVYWRYALDRKSVIYHTLKELVKAYAEKVKNS